MKTINLIIGFLFFTINITIAQQQSTVKMTAAEYQSLVRTILKAKKKRTAQRRYYIAPPPNNYNSSTPASSSPTTAPIVEKKDELEKLYAQIILQQQRDNSNNSELEKVKQNLLAEMETLDTQLKTQQKENERLTNKYYEKSSQENSELTDRNIDLKFQLRAVENELASQERTTESLERALERLQRKIENVEEDQKTNLRSSEKEYTNEIEKLEQQLDDLEKQQLMAFQLSKNPNNENTDVNTLALFNQELFELRSRVQSLESIQYKSDDNAPAPTNNTQVTLLENKVKALEAQVNQLSKIEKPKTPDYNTQISALQVQLQKMEKQLAKHNHTSTPVIVAPKVDKIEKPIISNELRTFIESHRQQNIFFQNGSAALTVSEKNKIQELANQLSIHQQVDITIKAFASNTGSWETNQKLSQQRAENVRSNLINLGIRPNRLILEPLGVDTTSKDPANARRAEIHLFIKGGM